MADTLTSYLESQASLVQQAALALPHQFSTCTHSQGYIRQSIYLCLTCALPRGICSACSIACHTDHEQLELFPKRHFRCDCPTTSIPHKCTLHKGTEGGEEDNAENHYGQNFEGLFCRCGRTYEAEKERETMIQCLACEVGSSWLETYIRLTISIGRTGFTSHVFTSASDHPRENQHPCPTRARRPKVGHTTRLQALPKTRTRQPLSQTIAMIMTKTTPIPTRLLQVYRPH